MAPQRPQPVSASAAALRIQALRDQARRLKSLGASLLAEPIPPQLQDLVQRLAVERGSSTGWDDWLAAR